MLQQFLTSHSSIQSALPILSDAALKGAILVAIAAAAAYLLRKRSAASRHAAWTAAVIGHLAIPALVLFLPRVEDAGASRGVVDARRGHTGGNACQDSCG